ncbi:endonuclease/exonuclease/phosphatase family protein [Croceibacterium sp. LX-88]|uniref:Endonuclease/exonuclease/phosphatase family protein n=1 Tax=Croceibacterium selenioxidans TaxID=2838833 RepID=A0ABS5W6W2_9SPHN|nr:endonuclease/exonuclease/phosphatase family protein [Croceibacterium selenioxidans]MBT2134847.1 endonuclease/exonuclease/phosphatase family protein [Croceibacterium selenioxidans]
MVKPSLSLLVALGMLSGCSSLPPESSVECLDATRPHIRLSEDGKTAFTEIDVLTYNIEGLPWPARTNRGPYLEEIGKRLAAFRSSGEGPDIIVFQEVFSGDAADAVLSAGYRSIVVGPRRRSEQAPNTQGALPGRRNIFKGEIGLNVMSAGLVIATDFPIVAANYVPYASRSCAGFDCLSNKGVLYAEVAIPGVPGVVDVFTTHMNSQRASGVSEERHAAAHARQTNELAAFVSRSSPLTDPILIGGDFNMRNSDVRHYTFDRISPLGNVHRYCSENRDKCDVRQDWEHEDQWRRVQNLHLYQSGNVVQVRPLRVEGMFDGGPSGPVLSDHNGFRVVYELSWPASETDLPPTCAWSPTTALAL